MTVSITNNIKQSNNHSSGEWRNNNAFAVIKADGSVVTWGGVGYFGRDYFNYGGDSSAVAAKLNGSVDVTQIFSNNYAFAALCADGTVITWGNSFSGSDSSAVAAQLNGTIDVTQVFSTVWTFAAPACRWLGGHLGVVE